MHKFDSLQTNNGNDTQWSFAHTFVTTQSAAIIPVGSLSVKPFDESWQLVDGQILPIAEYKDLFNLTGHNPKFNWSASKLICSSPLNAIASNDDVFVAVGNAGKIFTSIDGINWDEQDSGVRTNLNAIAYDFLNRVFVAVGNVGTILTSKDGIKWVQQTSGTKANLFDVKYNVKTVAVGFGGAIVVSTDSIGWSLIQPEAVNLTHIEFLNNSWLAYADNGNTVISSVDGIIWSAVAIPVEKFAFIGIDSKYHVIDKANGNVYSSADSAIWTLNANNLNFAISPDSDLTAFSMGCVVGLTGDWSCYTTNGFKNVSFYPNITQLVSVICDPAGDAGQRWIIGQSTEGFVYSTDGIDWIRDGSSVFPGVGYSAKSVYCGGLYFILSDKVGQVFSAAEPYNPATHFQITARKSPLYIKAT